jgi:pentatricopeptide repeat protein
MCNNFVIEYSNNYFPQEMPRLHYCMLRRGVLPNEFTLSFVLKACTRAHMWEHALAEKLGFVQQVFIGNTLLHSYVSAELLRDSRRVFDEMVDRNIVSWNSMTGGCVQVGDTQRGTYLVQRDEASRFVDICIHIS